MIINKDTLTGYFTALKTIKETISAMMEDHTKTYNGDNYNFNTIQDTLEDVLIQVEHIEQNYRTLFCAPNTPIASLKEE